MSKSGVIILVMEAVGAILVSAGIGLAFLPAGIVAFGFFMICFGIAVERSLAQ